MKTTRVGGPKKTVFGAVFLTGIISSSLLADNVTPLEISAARLVSEYKQNELAADQKFQGKSVAVTGVIGDVDKDFEGTPRITLKTGYWSGVQCKFKPSEVETLTKLIKGQRVKINGIIQGSDFMSVVLDECEVVEILTTRKK